MKNNLIVLLLLMSLSVSAAKIKKEVYQSGTYGTSNNGTTLTLKFKAGKAMNYPLVAIWLADENGKYIQTLYVSQSVGKGTFEHVKRNQGQWMPGEIIRPATLPYWAHQRNKINEIGNYMPTKLNPVPDAYSGASFTGSFIVKMKSEDVLKGKYKLMLEVNQSWDWNEFWTNNKYPDDKDYKTSSQPALVYEAVINADEPGTEVKLIPVGHSHYSGKDGSLNSNLKTLTTALQITSGITVKVGE